MEIQAIALEDKNFFSLTGIGDIREKGPFAGLQRDSLGEEAHITGDGEGAARGDRIIVVLNGFPSFLQRIHNNNNKYKERKENVKNHHMYINQNNCTNDSLSIMSYLRTIGIFHNQFTLIAQILEDLLSGCKW